MNKKRIIYIPFDQLHRNYGALKSANKEDDLIVFVESERMVDPKRFHPLRLFFLVSSARHFAAELEAEGFSVEYVQAQTTRAGLEGVRAKYGTQEIYAAQQSSYRLHETLVELGATFCENDFFLTPRTFFK